MSLTPNTDNLDIIAALADLPNDVDGLTAEALKAKFDQGPKLLKTFINNLITEIEAQFESKYDLENIRKLSPTGDFTGSWHGITDPALADPGIAGSVLALKADTAQRAINVKSAPYNATGGGVTDDTATIQAAIDAVSSSGGIVYLPPGTYKITSKLTIDAVGVMLIGSGIDVTILQTSGLADAVLYLDGSDTPAYRSHQAVQNLTIKSTTQPTGSIGVQVHVNASFRLDFVKITGFETGFYSQGSLIYELNQCEISANKTGVKLEKVTTPETLPPNLILFNNCRIILNTERAVYCTEGALVHFLSGEIETNGTSGSGLNVCHFENMATVGVAPSVIFEGVWFETNKGLYELYVEDDTNSAGVTLLGCSFYSTDVTYNVYLVDGIASIIGCGLNATTSLRNLYTNSNVRGVALGSVLGSFLSDGALFYVQDSTGMISNMYIAPQGLLKIMADNSNGTRFKYNGAGDLEATMFGAFYVSGGKGLKPPYVTAANAVNDSIYVDSATGILTFKDSTGTSHSLY